MFDPRSDIGRPDAGLLAALRSEPPSASPRVDVTRLSLRVAGVERLKDVLADVGASFESVLDQLDAEKAALATLRVTSFAGGTA